MSRRDDDPFGPMPWTPRSRSLRRLPRWRCGPMVEPRLRLRAGMGRRIASMHADSRRYHAVALRETLGFRQHPRLRLVERLDHARRLAAGRLAPEWRA